MTRYDKTVLSALIDSYEKSRLFTGENKVNRRIAFVFTKKSMPDYFNESSTAYEEIHAAMGELVRLGVIEIVWKRGREDHIIEKVLLNTEKLTAVYQYLGRKSKAALVAENKALLMRLKAVYESTSEGEDEGSEVDVKAEAATKGQSYKGMDAPICQAFLDKLISRFENNQSVKEYIELDAMADTEKLVKCVAMIERNQTACFYRDFSIRHFADSKYFENKLGIVGRIFREFASGVQKMENSQQSGTFQDIGTFQDMETRDILAEYQIYHTPGYVYFKGEGIIKCGDSTLKLTDFLQGIGLAEASLADLTIVDGSRIKRVITIENLTTFTGWQEKDSLLLYLGGYHNGIRRRLLQIIYRAVPEAKYLHFGDIDCGGFSIYFHLCEKTGIPFETYRMDCETLLRHRQYAKVLTENDRKRLYRFKEKYQGTKADWLAVWEMMLAEGIKLEQEAVCI